MLSVESSQCSFTARLPGVNVWNCLSLNRAACCWKAQGMLSKPLQLDLNKLNQENLDRACKSFTACITSSEKDERHGGIDPDKCKHFVNCEKEITHTSFHAHCGVVVA